jgi:hypothetical protein
MHNRNLYEPFDTEQLRQIVLSGNEKWDEALAHEFNYGSDDVFELMYESIAPILLMDREELLDRIGLMDKYLSNLEKYNKENDIK